MFVVASGGVARLDFVDVLTMPVAHLLSEPVLTMPVAHLLSELASLLF